MDILGDKNNQPLKTANGLIKIRSDAIIDLRSTFGVNKNVSNEVQYAKLYNNSSQVFRDVNSACIENGNGFDFAANTNGYLEGKSIKDITGDFFIGGWFKFKNTPVAKTQYPIGAYPSGGALGMYMYIRSDDKIGFYTGNENISSLTLSDVTYTDWNYLAVERVGNTAAVSVNGIVRRLVTTTQPVTTGGNKLRFGNVTSNYFDGQFDDIQFFDKKIYNSPSFPVSDEAFTPPIRSSE